MDVIGLDNNFSRIIGNSIYHFKGNRLIKYEINNSVKKLINTDANL